MTEERLYGPDVRSSRPIPTTPPWTPVKAALAWSALSLLTSFVALQSIGLVFGFSLIGHSNVYAYYVFGYCFCVALVFPYFSIRYIPAVRRIVADINVDNSVGGISIGVALSIMGWLAFEDWHWKAIGTWLTYQSLCSTLFLGGWTFGVGSSLLKKRWRLRLLAVGLLLSYFSAKALFVFLNS